MGAVSAVRHVDLESARAWALWTDVDRWPAFVDGFARVVERERDWPAEGARLTWSSTTAGRGDVTERVTASEPGVEFTTEVAEEALAGTQRVTFAPAGEGVARVELRLDYRLVRSGPLRTVVDVLFIRRALSQALERTLTRFAAEAADEAPV